MLLMIEKPCPTFPERARAGLGAALHAVPAALDAILAGPFRRFENRRTMQTMAAMSDHDLRDIGLTRGDIRDATAIPPGSDGSLFLSGRREARRRRR